MKALLYKMASFAASEEGPTVAEYAFMLALLLLLVISAISIIGNKVSNTFTVLEAGLPSGN